MSACAGCVKVRAALEGREASLVAVLPHSVVLLGEHQAFPGYVVVWSRAHAEELHQLDAEAYDGFHRDLRRVGQAMERTLKPWKLNLVSLGNVVRHAHVHVFPRQADDAQRLRHPWVYEADFGDPGSPELRAHWIARLREALA